MKTKYLILLFICFTFSYNTFGQPKTKAAIKNVDFELFNDNLIITYDIVNYKTGEKFNVSINIYTSSGEKIGARTFMGDIYSYVPGGDRKKIVWDIIRDKIYLDNDIYVEVSARPQMDTKSYTKISIGQCLLLSSVYPGWGNYKIKPKKSYFLIGVFAFGFVASSVTYNRLASSSYDNYLNSTDIVERNDFYKNADTQKQLSNLFIYGAAAVWIADLAWVAIKAKKSKKSSSTSMNKGIFMGAVYNPVLEKPMLSMGIAF